MRGCDARDKPDYFLILFDPEGFLNFFLEPEGPPSKLRAAKPGRQRKRRTVEYKPMSQNPYLTKACGFLGIRRNGVLLKIRPEEIFTCVESGKSRPLSWVNTLAFYTFRPVR